MPALVERPKMSLAMWAALKTHIMKQREKKKQEQEADAAVERLRREQEMKRKQDAMTLEEIRDQLSHSDKKLSDLRVEKHELFLYLKRVLNEDDKRRNEEDKEPNDMMQMQYGNPTMANLYMIGGMNRNPVMYKVQTGNLKRPSSPSYPFGYRQTYPVQYPDYHLQQGYNNMHDEKYYIQQSGSISSGYPVRGQPPSRFQPPRSTLQVPCRKDR